MCEIALIAMLCRGLGTALRSKGYQPIGYQVAFVLGWFPCEIGAMVLGFAAAGGPRGEDGMFLVVVCGLMGAAGWASLFFLLVHALPPSKARRLSKAELPACFQSAAVAPPDPTFSSPAAHPAAPNNVVIVYVPAPSSPPTPQPAAWHPPAAPSTSPSPPATLPAFPQVLAPPPPPAVPALPPSAPPRGYLPPPSGAPPHGPVGAMLPPPATAGVPRVSVPPAAMSPTPLRATPPAAPQAAATEPIRWRCEHCGHTLRAAREQAGRRAKCPECQRAVTIPAAQGASEVLRGRAVGVSAR